MLSPAELEVNELFVVVVRVDITTESDTALLSAVEIRMLCDVSLLFEVVVKVEVTVEPEIAFESAVETFTL